MASVAEFVAKLSEVPDHWRITATKSGASVEAWEPGGTSYCLVFTDDRPTRWLTNRTAYRNNG